MSYSETFLKHLADHHEGKAREHVIVREGVNPITGDNEMIAMLPWRVKPDTTEGHIEAVIEIVGSGKGSQRIDYVDYDGVISRTTAKLSDEAMATDLYVETMENEKDGDMEVRSKRDLDLYTAYARMAIDNLEWDGFEISPRGQEKKRFMVEIIGTRKVWTKETHVIMANSDKAAIACAKSGLSVPESVEDYERGDLEVEEAKCAGTVSADICANEGKNGACAEPCEECTLEAIGSGTLTNNDTEPVYETMEEAVADAAPVEQDEEDDKLPDLGWVHDTGEDEVEGDDTEFRVIVVSQGRIMDDHPVTEGQRPQEEYEERGKENIHSGMDVILVAKQDDDTLIDFHSGREVSISGVHFKYAQEA